MNRQSLLYVGKRENLVFIEPKNKVLPKHVEKTSIRKQIKKQKKKS